MTSYEHVQRWAKEIKERPAVQRGKIVNCTWGGVMLAERHSAEDITQVLK